MDNSQPRGGKPTEADPGHHAGTQSGLAAIDELASEEERLTRETRDALGIGSTKGPDGPQTPFLTLLRTSGTGWYPLAALCALGVADGFQSLAFNLYSPDIANSLGLGINTLASLNLIKTLAITLATLPVAAYVQRRPRRALVAVSTAFIWAISTVLTAYILNIWFALALLLLNGLASGGIRSVQAPLMMDMYPAEVRVRAFSTLQAMTTVGSMVTALLVVICSGPLGLTWRGTFLFLGFLSFAVALFGVRLRDPGFGNFDMTIVRKLVQGRREARGANASGPTGNANGAAVGPVTAAAQAEDDRQATLAMHEKQVELGFFEICRRCLMIPTVRRLMPLAAMFGAFLIPFGTYIQFYLQERWNMGATQRALFSTFLPALAFPALAWFAKHGEVRYRRDPARFLNLGSIMIGSTIVLLAVSVVMPIFALMIILLGLSFAGFFVIGPILNVITLSVVLPAHRPHLAALSGIFLAGVGGTGGLLLLSGINARFGITGAIVAMAIPGVLVAVLIKRAALSVNDDITQVMQTMVEDEELREIRRRGEHLPLLSCRHLNFSYGDNQVLFDVSFTVDDGEMVALLGTNGSGKSTLLRAISGIGLASHGTIHLAGAEITHLDPERRVGLGIAQVPGGRSVFRTMSVVDNLRVFGQTRRRDRAHMEQSIDAVFETFPVLAARRNSLAATLSGGEQQMLALGRVLIVEPRILLIDELSLGLAPVIVGQLLEMVKRINQEGTAVVLVEQSINIALSTVEHAYYMERGQIQFDGTASDLLERSDLLRSVFLEGAVQGLARGKGDGREEIPTGADGGGGS